MKDQIGMHLKKIKKMEWFYIVCILLFLYRRLTLYFPEERKRGKQIQLDASYHGNKRNKKEKKNMTQLLTKMARTMTTLMYPRLVLLIFSYIYFLSPGIYNASQYPRRVWFEMARTVATLLESSCCYVHTFCISRDIQLHLNIRKENEY